MTNRYSYRFGNEAAAVGIAGAPLLPPPATGVALNQAAPPDGNTTYDWVGDPGQNGSGNWDTPGDWQQDSVPAATSTATFATGEQGYIVRGDANGIGSISVMGDGVTFDGAIAQTADSASTFLTASDNASVTFDANSTIYGQGTIDFAAGSRLFVNGAMFTNGGTADLVVESGAGAKIISTGALELNALYVQAGATFGGDITLNAAGTIEVDSDATISGGTISLLGSGLIYEALAGVTSGTSLSDDVVTLQGGTLTVGTDPTAFLNMTGTISGAGDLLVNGGFVGLAGALLNTGSTSVLDGTLDIEPGSTGTDRVISLLDQASLVYDGLGFGNANSADTVVAYGTSDTISAFGGNLLVYASQSGQLNFTDNSGKNTVVGGAGALNVSFGGAGGGELLYGGTGTLTYTGGVEQSTVVGNAGVVDATGGSAGDLIYGGTSGHDMLNTGNGPSTLVGGNGAILAATGSANSVLVSGGNDQLIAVASSGNDTLFGAGSGFADTIDTSTGTSTVVLSGGASGVYTNGTADIFAQDGVLTMNFISGNPVSIDNVLSFNLSTDHIALYGYGDNAVNQILSTETISGGNTVLQTADGDRVTLFGVTGLTTGNFTSV